MGLTLGGLWFLVAILAPWIAPHNPIAQDSALYLSPSQHHLFGTDELGRDVFSRVLWGARISIPLALLLVSLAQLIRWHSGRFRRLFRRLGG